MPQLNPEFFVSQLFWLTVFFSFLFIFLWKISLPRIANVLEKRQRKIDENLSSAKELQKQAMEIEEKINNQLIKTKQETDDQIKETINSLEDSVSSQLSSLDKELEIKVSKAEEELLKNRNSQMKDINEEIAKIVKLSVDKIAKIKLSDDDLNKSIEAHKEELN